MTKFARLYFSMMSSGKYLKGTFMFSASFIGVAKKKSLTSAVKKVAPLSQSEIVLFNMSFVSSSEAAGDPES